MNGIPMDTDDDQTMSVRDLLTVGGIRASGGGIMAGFSLAYDDKYPHATVE
jgi:hypothetical protein